MAPVAIVERCPADRDLGFTWGRAAVSRRERAGTVRCACVPVRAGREASDSRARFSRGNHRHQSSGGVVGGSGLAGTSLSGPVQLEVWSSSMLTCTRSTGTPRSNVRPTRPHKRTGQAAAEPSAHRRHRHQRRRKGDDLTR